MHADLLTVQHRDPQPKLNHLHHQVRSGIQICDWLSQSLVTYSQSPKKAHRTPIVRGHGRVHKLERLSSSGRYQSSHQTVCWHGSSRGKATPSPRYIWDNFSEIQNLLRRIRNGAEKSAFPCGCWEFSHYRLQRPKIFYLQKRVHLQH